MAEPIRITLQAGHVEDVAALANAAATAEGQSQLRDMYITVTETQVKFEVTDAYVASTRRGTIGEFGGKVLGTGTIRIKNARNFAAALRRQLHKGPKDPVTITFDQAHGEVRLNGDLQDVKFEDLTGVQWGPNFERLLDPLFEEAPGDFDMTEPPLFQIDILARAASSAGRTRITPLIYVGTRKWGLKTFEKDSWMFGTVFLETARG